MQRSDFGAQVAVPRILALIDEADDRGLLDVPAGCTPLWDNPAAWVRGEFIGPARAQIDPEKEAKADLLNLEGGLSSRTRMMASKGIDFENEMRTIAEERRAMEAAGLNPDVREGALAPSNPNDNRPS